MPIDKLKIVLKSGDRLAQVTIQKCLNPAYTNNENNSGKNHETFTCFSAVVGWQHIVKLTTCPFAPHILF